jgi:hypothetical protein
MKAREGFPLPKIAPYRHIARMREGDVILVGPCSPSEVSAAFTQLPGNYRQQSVVVVHPLDYTAKRMFLVERTS